MSHINFIVSGGAPAIPTNFTTDDGSAVPVANNINILGGETSENNDNGIETTGSGDTVTILLTNRVTISATTSDGAGQNQTVTLFTPINNKAITFKALVAGYDLADDAAIGGEQIGLARKSAGVAVVVGTNDTFDESDAALNGADWNVVSSGGDLAFQFIGIAGLTINWKVVLDYIQVP